MSGQNQTALSLTLNFNKIEFERLKDITEFAVRNFSIFDHVALDMNYAEVNDLNERIKSLEDDVSGTVFTRLELINLEHLIAQVRQNTDFDELPIDKDDITALVDRIEFLYSKALSTRPPSNVVNLKLGIA